MSGKSSGALFFSTVGFTAGALASYVALNLYKKQDKRLPYLIRRRTRRKLSTNTDGGEDGDGNGNENNEDFPLQFDREDFLTGIVAQLWEYMNPAGSSMISDTLEPMLKEYNIELVKVDLGNTPLYLDNVVVHEFNRTHGFVQFDLDILWDGQCEITMKAAIGKFGIKSIQMGGRMSFLLKPLSDVIPCIDAVSYAFINQPHLKLEFSGMAAVADMSIIDKTVQKTIHDSMAEMVVLPNRMVYKMDPTCSLLKIYEPPIGVVRIVIESGRGFQIQKQILVADDIPDVYCVVEMGNQTPMRTPTIMDNLEPVWTEGNELDFVLFDYDQAVTIHVWDEDEGPLDPDDDLGLIQFTVRELLLAKGRRKETELTLMDDNGEEKCTGAFLTVRGDLLDLKKADLASLEDTTQHHLNGLLTILLEQAFNIPVDKSKAATYVKVTNTATKDEFKTSIVKDKPGYDALNPLYDIVFHIPLKAGMKPDVTLTLINGESQVLGQTTIPFKSLMEAEEQSITDRRKLGGASLQFSLFLRTVEQDSVSEELAESVSQLQPTGVTASDKTTAELAKSTAPKIGKVRVTIVSGTGFQIKRKLFGQEDIPDIYCVIQFGSDDTADKKKQLKKDASKKLLDGDWTTSVVKNNTDPEWNESKNFQLASHSEVISLDVYDHNNGKFDKDDYLGRASIAVGKLLLSGGGAKALPIVNQDGKTIQATISVKCELVD